MGSTELETQVREVFAEVTRYPTDVFTPSADLEDELGIDSVKRAAILVRLQERFHLPAAAAQPMAGVSTLAGVVAAIQNLLANQGAVPPPAQPLPATAPAPARSMEAVARLAVETMAQVTRYPQDILVPAADLEEDLGIESVKRMEILVALRDKFGLSKDASLNGAPIRTVGDVISAIQRVLEDSRPAEAPVVAAPAPAPSPALRPFAGKVAFVTGSGHGLGKVIAQLLAESGAEVVVNSFHSRDRGEETAAEIVAAGGKAVHLWGSVAQPEQLKGLFAEIERRHGHLDFFVSNASNGIIAPLDQVTPEQWERAFRTNVVALHQGALHAARLMKPRGGGRIVCLSSPGAHQYIDQFGCMGPIKAALESLTRYLAVDLGSHNIQVNCVSAGPVYGDLLNHYPDHQRLIPYWESITPGQRLGNEQSIARVVRFLLSPESAMMNGSVVLVDGAGSIRV